MARKKKAAKKTTKLSKKSVKNLATKADVRGGATGGAGAGKIKFNE